MDVADHACETERTNMSHADKGKVITALGLIDPSVLGRVMMHEHLHSDLWDWEKDELIKEEKPATAERRQHLLDNAVPHLARAREEYGMGAYCDCTMPPWRCWPDLYREVSEASGVNIVIATGFYREIEVGKYYVKRSEDAIWPFVRESPEEVLAEMCIREIREGLHDTDIRAGCIKLGTSQPEMTEAEKKTFRAGARAQLETGVHVTTHCTQIGAETSQLAILEEEGVDLTRVVIGHTCWHLANPDCRRVVLEWMKRGANFLPTNMCEQEGDLHWIGYTGLIDAIHEAFDAGLGEHLLFGLDSGYCSEAGPFEPAPFLPPDPWLYMFTDVLPAFREMGLTADEEEAIMVTNPARILPVQ